MGVEFSDKRQFKRVPLTLPFKGKCLEKLFHSHSFQGETRNVSYEGLCIKVNGTNGFNVGEDIEVKTRLYPGDFFLKVKGIVCWVHSLSDPDWPINVGVKITHMRHRRLWVERIANRIGFLAISSG